MGKRGRKPIAATIDDLDDTLRGEVDEALRSEARESASSVFRRFGLAQRGLRLDTFIRYARKLRQLVWTDEPPLDRDTPSIEEIRDRLLVAIYETAKAGAKPHELASLFSRVQAHDRNEIRKAADERAQELHDKKLERLEPVVKDAIASSETQGSKDLRGILEQVSTGGMTIDAAMASISDCIWVEIDKHMRGAA